MISDKLYECAFAYKKTKLWEVVWDLDVFAVKLSDGRVGYISIMGAAGKHCALGVYIGQEGLDSFRYIASFDQFKLFPFEFHAQVMQQDCIQCSFEKRDDLSPEEQEEVRAYARANGIRLAGAKAFPRFTRYRPNRCPWLLQTKEEQDILCQALTAATALAGFLKEKSPAEIGIVQIGSAEQEIPMLEKCGGAYILTKAVVPGEKPTEYPAPGAGNDVGIAKLKKLKKAGVWDCGIVLLPEPVRDEENEVPYFPTMFLAVEVSSGYTLPLPPIKDYEKNAEALLDIVIEGLLRQKVCPRKIRVRDERTYVFVKELCRRLRIMLEMAEDLDALREAEAALLERLDMDEEEELEEFFDAVEMLLEMDDEQLHNLPAEILQQFEFLVDQGVLPEDTEEKVRQIFSRVNGGGIARKAQGSNIREISLSQSYVISVSLGSGCYRHIRVPGSSTLVDLHRAILDAFEFDDDHAHAFFMDNQKWSDHDSYYAEGVEPGARTTQQIKIKRVGLYEGKRFKYLFDFGDEWIFQCRVLKVLEGDVPEITVIRTKGEAPSQYGGEEENWDD